MYIGANDYSQYDPDYCDGRFCPRDCEHCPVAEQMMEGENEKQQYNG